ncbi:MAG TPA: thioredoxin family protein, partial [Actinomycetota bacterium]|nr:thioredoxin family protein [Actinomycetota bacterium]
MAVQSTMTPLGSPLPAAALSDPDGRHIDLRSYAAGEPLLVVFACNHCPYVRWLEHRLGEVVRQSGVRTVAINPNDSTEYPDDDPDGMRAQAHRAGWRFPYLIDGDQDVARVFGAVCTPDFFLYDQDGLLAYRGAFDASTPKNGQPLTGALLEAAIGEVLAGRAVPEPHRPSMGCSIKWQQS